MNSEAGVSRCNHLHIEWINNKVLLYSSEDHLQYLMINHNKKEYKNVYIRIAGLLCCIPVINPTL